MSARFQTLAAMACMKSCLMIFNLAFWVSRFTFFPAGDHIRTCALWLSDKVGGRGVYQFLWCRSRRWTFVAGGQMQYWPFAGNVVKNYWTLSYRESYVVRKVVDFFLSLHFYRWKQGFIFIRCLLLKERWNLWVKWMFYWELLILSEYWQ